MLSVALNLSNEAEIENYHTALFCHQNIGRFDITMKFPGLMQAVKTIGELAQRGFETW